MLRAVIRRLLGVEEIGWHYHVDVFTGRKMRFLSGFLLLRERSEDGKPLETWVILDDNGLLGDRGEKVSVSLPLREAMRKALVMLRELAAPPIWPVWNSAPYELLGYRRGGLSGRASIGPWRLPLPMKREQAAGDRVGPAGSPER